MYKRAAMNEKVFYETAKSINDHCKKKVKHLYFVQIFELNLKLKCSEIVINTSRKVIFPKKKHVDEGFFTIQITIESDFSVICKDIYQVRFFGYL